MKKLAVQKLETDFEKETQRTWQTEHPTPIMKRKDWMSLCGEWELFVKKDAREEHLGQIIVPYPPEARISGIERELKNGEVYIYKREFSLHDSFSGKRILLHFGAVDQSCEVFINNKAIGCHMGGYTAFTFDITDYVTNGNNSITVVVKDELCTDLPYGKQRKKRGGMWYTPISGIWQSVWLEAVCENYIKSVKITPSLDSVLIEVEGGEDKKKVIINGCETAFEGKKVLLRIENPVNWSPENPYLYDFYITDGNDMVESYFALRTIEARKDEILLNGKPYFFNGVLDQGYYSDGIYTPASPCGYEWDILTMKEMGFNMLRKHIKIEPDLFYYYCDKLGMVVFQDAVNNGKYHYITDTVLPTIGFKFSFDAVTTKKQREAFETTLCECVEMLYNHPSVCYWTIFNEGWGQYQADRIYEKMKEIDPTRVWDATSGWFKKKKSDVISEHVYFRRIKLKSDKTRPLVLSEFGGYGYKIPEHSYNGEKTYGYGKFENEQDFYNALEDLYLGQIVPAIEMGLCAAVLTQLSDVEDEVNGLVTYDRKIVKVNKEKMRKISRELFWAFSKRVKQNEN